MCISLERARVGHRFTDYSHLSDIQREQYKQAMRDLLEPIYGDQSAALEKIRLGEDRKAEVALDEMGKPSGTLVYKTEPTSETHWNMIFGDTVVTNKVLEVKTLAVFDVERNGNKGIGTLLVERALQIGASMDANGIILTASDGAGVQRFFNRHEFGAVLTKTLDYSGRLEPLMYRSLKPGGIDKSGKWFF